MLEIFLAFVVAFAILAVAHSERNRRAYKMFMFGFLVSILYASVFAYVNNPYPVFFLVFTSLAILTQYFHMRAVEAGRANATKLLVDVSKSHDLGKNKPEQKKFEFVV